MADWINDLEKELKDIKPNVIKITKEEDGGFLPVFLLSLLLLLGYIVWNNKKTNVPAPLIPQQQQLIEVNPNQDLTMKIAELEKNIKWSKDRVTLMGALMNNNFSVYNKYHRDPDSIIINRDWTINQMPKHIDLSDKSDFEEIQKWLKK